MRKILPTQPNFRDIGGLPAHDGRKVKTGLLYRSGALHKITDDEVRILGDLGIRQVIDFRSQRERGPRPDRKIGTVMREINLPIEDGIYERVQESFERNEEEVLKTLLADEYRRMIAEHSDAFRDFFAVISEEPVLPAVFHCAMGKDRTGLAGYFLLHVLGVPEALNRRHYLESNDYLEEYIDELVERFTEPGKPAGILRPLFSVSGEYLDAGLDEIRTRFGSLDNYIFSVLKADAEAIRGRYLE